MKRQLIPLAVLACVAAGLEPRPVAAQEAQPPATAQPERAEPQEEGAKKQKKKKESAESEAAQNKKADWGFHWADHPSFRFGPGTHVDFRLRLQGDMHGSDARIADDGEIESIDVARRRIGIDGEILNLFDYQVERELGDDSDPWRDVYVNYKQFGFAEFRAGKFKLPFSLDENTSATNLDFVYRSRIAALLAPGRDRGVMAHGRVLDRGILRYEFGWFAEDGNNVRTRSTDRVHGETTWAGRAVVQPFRSTKSPVSDLALGLAFTRSDLPEGVTGIRGRTDLDAAFWRPTPFVSGTRQRVGFEARWRPGPFSVKSEYIRLEDERRGQGVDDTDLSPFVASGWYVSGTWAVTGERKADGLDSPRRPLFNGGAGALEVAVRVERIRFGTVSGDVRASDSPRADVILGNAERAYTFGVNWYANRWIKIQANLVRNAILFPDQGPLPSQPVYWTRLIRFQFSM
jgi:phosphate-selective porin OprO and OprP